MSHQNANGYLSDVGGLSSHIWASDNLQTRFILNHVAIVWNASCRVSLLNQWMSAIYKLEVLILINSRLAVIVV
jgi:hypothetical protein